MYVIHSLPSDVVELLNEMFKLSLLYCVASIQTHRTYRLRWHGKRQADFLADTGLCKMDCSIGAKNFSGG